MPNKAKAGRTGSSYIQLFVIFFVFHSLVSSVVFSDKFIIHINIRIMYFCMANINIYI